jgi:hypothetical protein
MYAVWYAEYNSKFNRNKITMKSICTRNGNASQDSFNKLAYYNIFAVPNGEFFNDWCYCALRTLLLNISLDASKA